MRAERVRAPQARPQVVRVGDAVQDQQQRRFGRMLEHVAERDMGHRGVDGRDDTLVTLVPCKLVEPALVDRMHANAGDLRALDQVARPSVVPSRGDVQLAHGCRSLAQPGGDCVKSDEETGVGQRERHECRSC